MGEGQNSPAGGPVVEEFLAAVGDGPAGLVLEGDAGIGKTRLWLAAVEAARQRGYRVLVARAAQAEASLAYAVIADLLDDVEAGVTAALPDVQRLALDRLLLRGDADGPDTDHRVAAAAVLSTAETLCRDIPVVLAVDDVQWLDVCSRDVLGFVARRLDCPVGLLLTERTENPANHHSEWLQLSQPDRMRRHRVAPLTLGGLHAMLFERLGRSFPRPTLIRLAETSGGNPLYALELARALSEQTAAGEPALPASLADVVRRRIQDVDEVVRDVLLAAACVAAPTVDLVASATEKTPEETLELLEAAEDRGLVEIDGATVRFAHPLLARGVYSEAGPARRRHMHRRLAGAIAQPEQKARHLALAATSQDDDTLAALDAAADAARRRGAPAAAAELLEFALRLGGDTDLRRLQAAAHYFTAGDSRRAQELLTATLPRMPRGPLRAIASMQLAGIVMDDNDFQRGLRLLDDALRDSESDPTLQVHCLLSLAMAHANVGGHLPALRHADRAVAIAEDAGPDQLVGHALTVRAFTRFIFGLGTDGGLQRALAYEDPDADVPLYFRARAVAGLLNSWTGRLDEAYTTLQELRTRSLDRGADRDLLALSVSGTLVELWRGRLDEAATYADDAVERAEQVGGENSRLVALGVRGMVSAYAGRVRAARADAETALEMARHSGMMRMMWWPMGLLAFIEVSLGNYPHALTVLDPLIDDYLGTPGNEIFASFFVPDAVEALIAVGRNADAQPLIERFDADGQRLDRPWLSAVAGRGRGMDLAARGDLDGAVAAVTAAMTHHDRVPMPFERARTALLLGQLQRRQRRKEAAAATLRDALETFENIGTTLWAQRARDELTRVNVRPSRDRALTPSEQRVAELASAGMSNRDIAAALFISIKTVEANLGRIYRKLGVRGRVALARRLEELGDDGA